jgi:acyl-CoA synthetase (AMP-forming)/AMP-acid ligase II
LLETKEMLCDGWLYTGKITEEEIMGWCKDNMAAYKRPKLVEFRTDLPKSPIGNAMKRVLIEEEQQKQ